jgi:asparagine synthase (glutamine-hydrolysing)
LAIIDLSANAQPMLSADARYAVTFNGEIYNYRELREHLERQGRRFQSASDTEVFLHLYKQKGADMVSDLRGMFAFPIWDTKRHRGF